MNTKLLLLVSLVAASNVIHGAASSAAAAAAAASAGTTTASIVSYAASRSYSSSSSSGSSSSSASVGVSAVAGTAATTHTQNHSASAGASLAPVVSDANSKSQAATRALQATSKGVARNRKAKKADFLSAEDTFANDQPISMGGTLDNSHQLINGCVLYRNRTEKGIFTNGKLTNGFITYHDGRKVVVKK
jgi:hypothetical protein